MDKFQCAFVVQIAVAAAAMVCGGNINAVIRHMENDDIVKVPRDFLKPMYVSDVVSE